MSDLEIFDRGGGGGDSFASGLIYGLMVGKGPQWVVDCGCAHSAMAMTTPGETTMATLGEAERLMRDADDSRRKMVRVSVFGGVGNTHIAICAYASSVGVGMKCVMSMLMPAQGEFTPCT